MSGVFKIADADDTAEAFMALRWGGYPARAEVFAHYDNADCFCTFPGDSSASTSVNIHILSALRMAEEHPQATAWIAKILQMLGRYKGSSPLWFDKWHVSPYYATCEAICAIQGLDDALIQPSIEWISWTQREDGGWGFYEHSTPEETAYAVQVLLRHQRAGGRIAPGQITAGARYLCAHLDDSDASPLWVGKGLFTPPRVVRAAILSALYSFMSQ